MTQITNDRVGLFKDVGYDDIRLACCDYFACSDFMDRQYPFCKHKFDFAICPAVKFLFRLHEIDNKAKRLKDKRETMNTAGGG